MKFIITTLKQGYDERETYLNIDDILLVIPYKDGTAITLKNGGELTLTEKADSVMAKVREACMKKMDFVVI